MRILVLNSGGVKSAFLLAYAAKECRFGDLFSLFVDYGQPASEAEYRAAKKLAMHYKAYVKKVHLNAPTGNLPFKQTLFYWQALLVGQYHHVENVYIGPSRDDHIPEATAYYIQHVKALTEYIQPLYDEDDIYHPRTQLLAPLIRVTRSQVVGLGADYMIPWNLTYSCEKGNKTHCGKCASCRQRKRTFQKAGIEDPYWVEFLT